MYLFLGSECVSHMVLYKVNQLFADFVVSLNSVFHIGVQTGSVKISSEMSEVIKMIQLPTKTCVKYLQIGTTFGWNLAIGVWRLAD